jgi:hypothetical protein
MVHPAAVEIVDEHARLEAVDGNFLDGHGESPGTQSV